MKERNGVSISGWSILFLFLVGFGALAVWVLNKIDIKQIPSLEDQQTLAIVGGISIFLTVIIILPGFFINQPNERKVLMFLGHYIGTVKKSGYRWTIPFFSKKRISVRLYNFETKQLKVNDLNGNPIEIGAVVVWRVCDTAKALFEVDSYEAFVNTQSESALRNIAMKYPYENHGTPDAASLISKTEEVAKYLAAEIQTRVEVAGVEIIEARISHLAYSREIAHAMLQKQQASAVVAARHTIIEGAVGLVEMALKQLEERHIVQLSEDKKAALVSNLLVVLCSESNSQPIMDVGGK